MSGAWCLLAAADWECLHSQRLRWGEKLSASAAQRQDKAGYVHPESARLKLFETIAWAMAVWRDEMIPVCCWCTAKTTTVFVRGIIIAILRGEGCRADGDALGLSLLLENVDSSRMSKLRLETSGLRNAAMQHENHISSAASSCFVRTVLFCPNVRESLNITNPAMINSG